MKLNVVFLLLVISICFNSKAFSRANPGYSAFSLSNDLITKGQSATLSFRIGNNTDLRADRTAVLPNEAMFVVFIPAELKLQGTIDISKVPFSTSVSTLIETAGLTITIKVPNGIPAETNGLISIPLLAVKESTTINYITAGITVKSGAQYNFSTTDDHPLAAFVVSNSLPVTLVSFKATAEHNVVNLSWSTTEEVNSERFDIEHSNNGKQWKLVGSVPSGRESNTLRHYTFSHQSVSSGNNYYRLKMVDNNQLFAFSRIQNVPMDKVEFTIFPNPVIEKITLSVADWTEVSSVLLLNLNGSAVYNSGSNPEQSIKVGKFAPGTYLVKLQKNDGSATTRRIQIVK
jgi:hypothetical protein